MLDFFCTTEFIKIRSDTEDWQAIMSKFFPKTMT